MSLKMARNLKGILMDPNSKGMILQLQMVITRLHICYSIADRVSHLFMHTTNLP